MGDVLDDVAKQMNCHVFRRRPENEEESGEYLGMDAVLVDKSEYDSMEEGWNPRGLPRAVVEHENRPDRKIISYALWKILCVRTPIRILICYQDSQAKVNKLKKCMEDFIRQGGLMEKTDGGLLIIIGNEGVKEESPWADYFTVYQWRNQRLEKVKVSEW
jgi:hypothetical protein